MYMCHTRDQLKRMHAVNAPASMFRKDRKMPGQQPDERSHGGILVACKTHLKARNYETVHIPDLEFLIVAIECPTVGSMRIVTIYR